MIPLKDENPSGTTPIVTYLLVTICALVFGYELLLGQEQLPGFIAQYGVIPVKYRLDHLGRLPVWPSLILPTFTCMFLHGGVLHLVGNMWYLWIFGDNVEDRLGHLRFLLFYMACGLSATVSHILLNADSELPVVGASGAIAGVLGAYLVSFPRARVLILLPIFLFYWEIIPMPAFLVLGFWFILQLGNGIWSVAKSAETTGGVAWWAHIGGFLVGIFLLFVLPDRKRWRKMTVYATPQSVSHKWR